MNFPVPWRCLLPSEAVEFVLYDDSAVLRELSDRTGAMIDVSGERDTPKRLSDRIVTISGLADQKEAACRGIVQKLRRLQDLQDHQEIGYFVLIVPAAAVPVVVGAKGVTIKEVLETSGVELSIGKENVMGMPDTPIGLEGTAAQVVSATTNIHKVIQDMADRGRLMPSDFKYRPERAAAALASGAGLGLPQVSLPPREHDPYSGLDPTQNFRTKGRIVVNTQVAGWLIGKGGRNIREMQTNSGAFLHLLREEEVLEGVVPLGDHRIIEICGRYERKLEGIQVVLRTADNMPGTQAPKEAMMLVPRVVALTGAVHEVGDMCNCSIDVKEFPGYDDVLVTIAGSISSRIQAAQAFLTRIDQAHMEGIWVARAPDGEVVGKDGRPRKELREDGDPSVPSLPCQQASVQELPVLRPFRERSVESSVPSHGSEEKRLPPQSSRELMSPIQSTGISQQGGADQVLQHQLGNGLVPQREQQLQQRDQLAERRLQPQQPQQQPHPHPQPHQQQRREEQQHHREQLEERQVQTKQQPQQPYPQQQPQWEQQQREQQQRENQLQQQEQEQMQHKQQREHHQQLESQLQIQQPQREPQQQPQQHPQQQQPHWQQREQTLDQQDQRQPQVLTTVKHADQYNQNYEDLQSAASHQPGAEPPPCPEPFAETFEHHLVEEIPSQAQFAKACLPASHRMDLTNSEALRIAGDVQALLAGSSLCAFARTQLPMLLPEAALQQALVPSGFLAEVAQRCQVVIDLGGEQLPANRLVLLTGTLAANAAAVFCLQEGLARFNGMCS